MNAQTTLWVCLALTLAIFVIEITALKKLKRAVKKKLEWESRE